MSSPLILSHDVNNDTITDKIWPLISNREVIAVNQAYVGDSGGVFYTSDEILQFPNIEGWQAYPDDSSKASQQVPIFAPSYQFLSKRLDGGKVAVLLMNSADATKQLTLNLSTVPGISCMSGCRIRDIWRHKNLEVCYLEWKVSVGPHDAAFITLESESSTVSIPFFSTVLLLLVSTMILLIVRSVKRGEHSDGSGSIGEMEKLRPHAA